MEAVAWKSSRDESGYKYNIQIDKIKGKRNENKIRKLMDGWTIYAEGFNIKEKLCKETRKIKKINKKKLLNELKRTF